MSEAEVNENEKEQGMRSFIETFETMPILWDSRNASYKNKRKRAEAMEKLLPVYRRIKQDANIKDVSKKINSLRSNYRKEIKKVIASKRSGSSPDDTYVPTSWTYYALNFLGGSELPVDYNEANEDSDEFVEESGSQTSVVITPSSSPSGSNLKLSLSAATDFSAPTEAASNAGSSVTSLQSPRIPIARKRPRGPIAKQNELLALACVNYLKK